MKLHLPKLLLTAVLAACTAPAAWATDAWSGTASHNDAWTVQNGDNIDTATADPNGDNNLFLRDEAGATNISANLTVSDLGKAYTLKIQGHWQNANNFDKLTIGTLTLNDADATLEISANNSVYFNSITANPTCAGINVYGTLELASGNAYQRLYANPTATSSDSDDAVDINVKNGGILDLTVYRSNGVMSFDYFSGINNNQNITTESGGWVKLYNALYSGDNPYKLNSSSFEVKKNLWIDGSVRFNGWNKSNNVEVLTDKAFKVTNDLKLESTASLVINGGLVEAGSITLGHNNTGENNPAHITLSGGGTLRVGTITLNSNKNQNTVTMTDGVLEITGTKAITAGSNTTSTIAIGGTESGKTVVLKAASQDWTLDYASGLTVKNVTIDAGNTRKITIDNATLNGSIINNKTLELGSGNTVSSLALSGSGTTTLLDGFTNAGTLDIASGSTVYLGGSFTNNGTITGTLSISSLTPYDAGSGTYTGGLNDGNGVYSGSYVIISSESTNKSGISISYNNTSYTTDANGAITPTTTDNTLFQITNTEAGEKVSTINAITTVTQIMMRNGTSLIVDANTADTINVQSGDSATLELNSASTDALSVSSFSADGATINVTKNAASKSAELNLGSIAHAIGSLVIGDGVTVTSSQTGKNGFITGSVTVNAGGILNLTTGALGWGGGNAGNYTDALTAEGSVGKLATIQFGDEQTLTTNLNLNGYTEVSGSAFSGFGGKVTVSGTNNTIKSTYRMRSAITFEVNGNLTMEGAITNFDDSGMLTKTGTGDMTITGNITTNHGIKISNGTLNINGTSNTISADVQAEAGELNISGNTAISSNLTVTAGGINYKAGTHSVGTLDLANGQNATGSVTLKKNETAGKQVVLTASTLWLRKAATLSIEEGATLKLGNNGIVNIKGTAGSTTSAVSSSNTGGGAKYLITGTDGNGGNAGAYTISNAEVSVDTSSAAQTISNILSNSKLVNGGVNKLTADNASSTYSAIDATKGSIDILNAQNQTLGSLTIGGGKTVGLYIGDTVPAAPTSADEATVTTSSLTVGGTGATLNANLVLSDGATVKLAAALTMGSSVTLGEGMILSGDLVSTIKTMSEDGIVDLFTGVDKLYLGDSTVASVTLDATSGVNLSEYFNFDGASDYYLGYDGTNVFAGVMPVPEPTTATLSLLALAGLAARRRRK